MDIIRQSAGLAPTPNSQTVGRHHERQGCRVKPPRGSGSEEVRRKGEKMADAPDLVADTEKEDEKIDGDKATMIDKNKPGEKHPLTLKKEGGNWKVELSAMPPEMTEMSKSVLKMVAAMDGITKDIVTDAGKYKTPEEAKTVLDRGNGALRCCRESWPNRPLNIAPLAACCAGPSQVRCNLGVRSLWSTIMRIVEAIGSHLSFLPTISFNFSRSNCLPGHSVFPVTPPWVHRLAEVGMLNSLQRKRIKAGRGSAFVLHRAGGC